MDVSVSDLRAQLGRWIERAAAGEEVVVTDRGTPVARLTGVSSAPLLERLTAPGVIARPLATRRPTASGARRVPTTGSVSEVLSEQRG